MQINVAVRRQTFGHQILRGLNAIKQSHPSWSTIRPRDGRAKLSEDGAAAIALTLRLSRKCGDVHAGEIPGPAPNTKSLDPNQRTAILPRCEHTAGLVGTAPHCMENWYDSRYHARNRAVAREMGLDSR